MRNLFLLPICFISLSMSAQTNAENWTQTDCAGVPHDLFETLDTGTAVVMEIVMLDGCMPCINAAHWMQPIIDQYNLNYNNRVHWYTFGYDDSYPCAELAAWKSDNDISCTAQFVEGAEIASYYGGMGMPTIVVAGRTSHSVYFNQFGFVPADTSDFREAITYALGLAEPVVDIRDVQPDRLSIYPNPVTDLLSFEGIWNSHAEIIICDLTGVIRMQQNYASNQLAINELPAGTYSISIIDGNKRAQAYFVHI